MKDGLYHVEVGLPSQLRIPSIPVRLNYTKHARNAATTDRYGPVTSLPQEALLSDGLIEVEVLGGTPVKVLSRQPYDDQRDLVLAVDLRTNNVKTLWFNLRSDGHRTLNRSRYVRPSGGGVQ